MISLENRNRVIFGIIYMILLLFGISYSSLSCSVLFVLIGVICLYEMWKLRKGKTKIIAILYILIPFILIQILIWNYLTFNVYDTENWNFEPILYLVILTSVFDSFSYIVGVKFGKNKIYNKIGKIIRYYIFGGDCVQYGLLAEGKIPMVAECDLKPFDFLPLVNLIEESGGIITDWRGNKLSLKSGGNVVASLSKKAHSEYIKISKSH